MKQRYPLLHKISEILLAAADRIADLARKAEDIPGKTPEFLVLLLYAASV